MYSVLMSDILSDLILKVNQKVGEGFQPLGGICVFVAPPNGGEVDYDDIVYYQAIWKPNHIMQAVDTSPKSGIISG